MDSRGIRKELNRFEEKYPVYNWEVDGFYIWPYLRFQIGAALITQGKMEKSRSSLRRLLDSFLKSLWAFIKDFNANEKVDKCDYLFWGNGVHSASINGEIYHARTDPLIEKLRERKYTVRKILIGNKYETPRKIKSFFVQPKLNFILVMSSLKYKLLQFDPAMSLRGYEDFLKDIQALGIDSKSFKKESLKRNVYIMFRYKAYFKKLLSKFKPKALFMVCYYSTPGFTMISACKELSIPVIDIQHGIQGDYHYAYGSWGNYSLSQEQSVLPDVFYVWSEEEAKSISKWKPDSMKVFIGGNDYLKMWQFGGNAQVQNYIDDISSKYNLSSYEKVVFYTLGGFDVVDENIVQALIDSPKNWLWIIRMHP